MPRFEDALTQARRHVEEGQVLVVRQSARVNKLRDAGHDTTEAEKLLWNLENTLRSMSDHLEYELRQGQSLTEGRVK